MTIEITLPTLHPGQVAAFKVKGRFKAVRCGRRWGKTEFGICIAADAAIKRQSVGWFAPAYKYIAEVYTGLAEVLAPVTRASSKVEGVIRTTTGGRIDFWSLENERAGASRKYHKVIIDEGAFAKENMLDIWQRSIQPTLLDYGGSVLVLSNTNGNDPANFFWQICNEKRHDFVQYHAPSWQNPHVPKRRPDEGLIEYEARRAEDYDALREKTHPLVFRQEYEAEFVDWGGSEFFPPEKLLVDRLGVDYPNICDIVFAVIDTAVKSGKEHDGTAVSYWSKSSHIGHPLICLDWELVAIDGALLENWIPGVFRRLEELAKDCRARRGSAGAWIEDAQTGSVLLQQCALRGLPARALPATLTAAGKDGRAINASAPVFQGRVKFSDVAFKNSTTFKGTTRNHMWSQVVGFRPGDKAAATRSDDLLDTFTYAVSIALGDSAGVA